MLGGVPRKIRDDGLAWSVSPDSSLIAFTTNAVRFSDIWLMGPNGEQPRKIVGTSENESFFSAVWSPTGRRIAYERMVTQPQPGCAVESRDPNGGHATLILTKRGGGGGVWWSGGHRRVGLSTQCPRRNRISLVIGGYHSLGGQHRHTEPQSYRCPYKAHQLDWIPGLPPQRERRRQARLVFSRQNFQTEVLRKRA